MATLIRIRLPNRKEDRFLIWTNKDHFVRKGNNYHIDYNQGFFSSALGGLLKVTCLDYEYGKEEPISYFKDDMKTSTELRPHHVAEVIRRLIEEIPHFQLIVLILFIIALVLSGIAVYYGYANGEKLGDMAYQVNQILNNTRNF